MSKFEVDAEGHRGRGYTGHRTPRAHREPPSARGGCPSLTIARREEEERERKREEGRP